MQINLLLNWYLLNYFSNFYTFSSLRHTKSFLILSLILGWTFPSFAQEGTKQLAPQESDLLYLLIYGSSGATPNNNFGSYVAEPREKIYIYLNAGETMFFGMRMDPEQPRFGIDTLTTFRVKDPDGNIVFDQTRFPKNGDFGFIRNYDEAVNGPNGVIRNGQLTTNGYSPLSYRALTTGNHIIEFETWSDNTFTTRRRRETAIRFFDVTVVDEQLTVITNPDNPDRSAGRLWSRQWSMTTKSFNSNPVNASFFIYTSDGFVNEVKYEMFPFEFDFVSNSFGVKNTNDAFENRRSLNGNAFLNNVSEHQIFLNDPDQQAFPSATVFPKIVGSLNGTVIFDYDQTRNPKVQPPPSNQINIVANEENCPHESEAVFLIESNTRAQIQILLDIDGNGFEPLGVDRVLYADLEEGVNQFPWDLRDGQGNLTSPGNFSAQIDVLFAGITHFPLFDVERMDSVITNAVRPFPREEGDPAPTLFWDDTNIDSLVIEPESAVARLEASDDFQRRWRLISTSRQINGNGNTLNSWFSGLEATSTFNYTILPTSGCTNRDHDRDNISDLIDIDDDNDGLTDMVESPNTGFDPSADEDGDGILNYEDADQPDYVDSNSDGVDDRYDFDLDGLPNFLDLDSDNDGIMDVIEAGGLDPDTNGIVFQVMIIDTDQDGFDDRVDSLIFGGVAGIPLPNFDTDNDGFPNAQDIDSDNDGIPDNREGQTTFGYIAPSEILGDSDQDGLNDAYDSFYNLYNETPPFSSFGDPISNSDVLLPVNTDGTDEEDYVEANSDNDPSPDWLEGFDDDEDGVSLPDFIFRVNMYRNEPGNPNTNFYPDGDANGNGVPDWLDDDDNDQVPNLLDPDHPTHYHDTDKDGLIDLYDRDSFGLGYGEASGGFDEPDNDGDARPNYRDTEPRVVTCVQTPLTTFTGSTDICPGSTLNLSADQVGAAAYTWRRGSTIISTISTLVIDSVTAADIGSDYTLEVTNGSCSISSDPFSINFQALPNLDINLALADTTLCTGDSTFVLLFNSEPGIDYQVQVNSNLVEQVQSGGSDTLSLPTGSIDADGIISFTVLASKPGCNPTPLTQTLTASIPLLPNQNLSFTISDTLLCSDNAGITLEINNTEADVQYQVAIGENVISDLINGNDSIIVIQTQPITTLGNNLIQVLARRADCKFVSLEDTLQVRVFSEPLSNLNVRASADNICELNNGILVEIDETEPDAFYQLRLGEQNLSAPIPGNDSTLAIPTGPLSQVGENKIVVLASKPKCNLVPLKDSVNVSVFEGPITEISISASASSLCEDNQGITVTVDSSQVGIEYQLFIGTEQIGNPIQGTGNPLQFETGPLTTIGVNRIFVTALKPDCESIGLFESAEVTVFSNEPSSVSIEIVDGAQGNQFCEGGTVTFRAIPFNGGLAPFFRWFVNGEIVARNSKEFTALNLQDQDEIVLRMVVNLPCDTTTLVFDTLNISIDPTPALQIETDLPEVVAGCAVELQVSGADTYIWEEPNAPDAVQVISNDGSQVIVNPPVTTTYIVTGTNANGCTAMDSIEIRVVPAQDIFVPSLFSPNADGNNDRFVIHGECIQDVVLQVFDRAGNLVYEAKTIEEATQVGWDGKHNGKEQPIGKYLWSIRGTTTDGQPLRFQGRNAGPINLLR